MRYIKKAPLRPKLASSPLDVAIAWISITVSTTTMHFLKLSVALASALLSAVPVDANSFQEKNLERMHRKHTASIQGPAKPEEEFRFLSEATSSK